MSQSGVGYRCSLDPVLLWLWHRLAAAALIWPLAWEPSHAARAAQEMAKKTKKKKMRAEPTVFGAMQQELWLEVQWGNETWTLLPVWEWYAASWCLIPIWFLQRKCFFWKLLDLIFLRLFFLQQDFDAKEKLFEPWLGLPVQIMTTT